MAESATADPDMPMCLAPRPGRFAGVRRGGRLTETAQASRQPVGPAAVFPLLRSRDFGPYFAGNWLSSSGTWFQNLAASLLVYRQTHSAFLLGVLNFCQFIPILVLVPWTGSAADRFDRRRLLLVTQSVAVGLGVAIAGLAWSASRRPRS
jgi:hypothetical protein